MTPTTPSAREVFGLAQEIADPAERERLLDRECAGRPEVRREVESLLRALRDAPPSFLQPPALPETPPYDPAGMTGPFAPTLGLPGGELPGTRFGPYRLVRELGRGGMGAVWLAEQEEPIRREVALKIILATGPAVAAVVARFEAERQLLTSMDHENIARVLDAGAAGGTPYLVMEYVPGETLLRYCDGNRLTLRERMGLFVAVCDAVQHAHGEVKGKGVMHRDLKPGNVLVTLKAGKPVVKVIDFGLAKPTETPADGGGGGGLTQPGMILGTPEYMSPEQADPFGEPPDHLTDVYSLGATMYALLVGVPPFDPSGDPIETVMKVRNDDPPPPDGRLAGMSPENRKKVADARATDPERLKRELRGEPGWIAMRAIEKKRGDRYASAEALAEDVRRYLAGDPVEAVPRSLSYRAGKFLRKRRLAIAVAAAFAVVVAVGLVGRAVAVYQQEEAQRKAREADLGRRAALRRTLATFRALTRGQGDIPQANRVILRNIQDEIAATIAAEPGESEVSRAIAAEGWMGLGELRRALGEADGAEAAYHEATQRYEGLAEARPEVAEYRSELGRGYFDLANLLAARGRRGESVETYRRAVDFLERLAAARPEDSTQRRDLADALNNLGAMLRDDARFPEARAAYERAIPLGEALVGEEPETIDNRLTLAASEHNLGNVVRDGGGPEGSLARYGRAIRALEPVRAHSEKAKQFMANAHWDRANALGQLGRHADAVADWRRALALAADPDAKMQLSAFLAASEADLGLAGAASPTGEWLYDAALKNAVAAAAAKQAGEESLGTDHARRGLASLERAREAGFFRDPARLKRLKGEAAFSALPGDGWKRVVEAAEAR